MNTYDVMLENLREEVVEVRAESLERIAQLETRLANCQQALTDAWAERDVLARQRDELFKALELLARHVELRTNEDYRPAPLDAAWDLIEKAKGQIERR